MRSLRSSRIGRHVVASAASAMLLVGVAIGVSVSSTGENAHAKPPKAPKEMSIATALAAFDGNSDFFLKVPGIPGDSTAPGHVNEIEVNTLSWGVTNRSTSVGAAGTAAFANVSVSKEIDKASPLIMKATAAGTPYLSVVFTAQTNADGPFKYMTLTLANARFTQFNDVGGKSGGIQESVSMSFTKIRFVFTPQDPDNGSAMTPVVGCWDLVHKTSCS